MIFSENPIFIIGVHRSGTTLLRYMLNRHPHIYIPPESDFIPRFFRGNPKQELSPKRVNQDLAIIFEKYRFVREWQGSPLKVSDFAEGKITPKVFLDTLYGAYAKQNGALRWGDKTPIYCSYIDLLDQIFPQAQFIHLIRDGRDVALSMLDKWGEQDFHIDVYFAARNWMRRIQEAQRSGEYLSSARYYELYYENLVASPEKELKSICEFLGETYVSEMSQPQKLAWTNIEPESFHAPLLEPPSTRRIERWKVEMQPDDLRLFQNVAGIFLHELGYQMVEIGPQSFTEKLIQVYLAIKYIILQCGRNLATALRILPPI